VLLFVYADNLGNIIEMSPRTLGQVLLFEHVARSRGLQIETVACNYTGQRLVYDRSSMRGDRVDVLGSIVIRAGLNDQVLFPLLRRLQATDRPIALFDEVRTPAGDARLRNLPLVRTTVFTDDVQAGRDVGTFLLASGHRRVAYFSARHGDQWSVDRLQGIRAAFADAGLENGVETFTTHCPTLAGADLSSEQIRARITRPAAERMVRTFVDSWHIAFRETMVNRIAVDARACMLLELQADHLGRMFSNAVSDRSVTAWIGANDDAAVECILYLRAKGIAVPDTISVLGFDDSATALTYRLSSYSFNPVGAMHMMLEHITRPQSPLFRSHPAGACVPASGYVNQRMTTTNRT
jgi:DNA-binding LacI/PurR family transcriptional regulator